MSPPGNVEAKRGESVSPARVHHGYDSFRLSLVLNEVGASFDSPLCTPPTRQPDAPFCDLPTEADGATSASLVIMRREGGGAMQSEAGNNVRIVLACPHYFVLSAVAGDRWRCRKCAAAGTAPLNPSRGEASTMLPDEMETAERSTHQRTSLPLPRSISSTSLAMRARG